MITSSHSSWVGVKALPLFMPHDLCMLRFTITFVSCTYFVLILHFEMYHKNCVYMFYPMFTHVWKFTYNTTYIFNCLSPYWKVPYSSKQFLLYVYPLFLGCYLYDKWNKHLPLSLPCKQGKCSLFTFLHIDNFVKPKYTLTFTWFEIFLMHM